METIDYDVIIIGGGLAGLTAAYFSLKAGRRMILIEKCNKIGGNSTKATSGINGALTQLQIQKNIKDSVELFTQDTQKSFYSRQVEKGQPPVLLTQLTSKSKEAIDWLISLGIDLTELCQLGGHSQQRTHRPLSKPIGFALISSLTGYLEKNYGESFKTITNSAVTDIDKDINGYFLIKVNGDQQIKGKRVIVCTGGFCHSTELLKQYCPTIAHLPTTNGPWTQGDLLTILSQKSSTIHAQLIDMEKVQVHPTGFIDPIDVSNQSKFLAPEALRGEGGIIIDKLGKRFCDELGMRGEVSDLMQKNQENQPFRILMNQEAATKFGPNFNFYYKVKKFFNLDENFETFAIKTNINYETIKSTIEEYNKAMESKQQDTFGKQFFPVKFNLQESIYSAIITPVLHYAMGGLKINEFCQVIDQNNNIIEGLFAAGEVTGGVHGDNRLGGNSLLECVVYGKIAAEQANFKIK